MKQKYSALMFYAATTLFCLPAHAAGDPENGEDIFVETCSACHSVVAGKNKTGPTLHGIVGRKAGSVPDFAEYSAAMKACGIVWNEQTLDAYIRQPEKIVAGNHMPFPGLADTKARADLIAYLESIK